MRYALRVACCLLIDACRLFVGCLFVCLFVARLLVVCCLLCVACCVLPIVLCSLSVARCSLFVVRCSLFIDCSTVCDVRCSLLGVR